MQISQPTPRGSSRLNFQAAAWIAGILLAGAPLGAQRVVPIYAGAAPGSETWVQAEREYPSVD